jgi:type IV pilus assembly protein PilN
MIRINLLPYRAAKKTQNVRRQIIVFCLTVILTLVAVFLYNRHLSAQIQHVETQIAEVNNELSRMKKQIAEIDQLRARIKMIQKRIGVIEQLEVNQLEAAFMLNILADLVIEEKGKKPLPSEEQPEGMEPGSEGQLKPDKRLWMRRLSFQNGRVDISGIALDNQTVADFMVRLQNATRPLDKTDRLPQETDAAWESRQQTETKPVFSSVVLRSSKQEVVKDTLKLKAFDVSAISATKAPAAPPQ